MENESNGMAALLVGRLKARRQELGLTLRDIAPKLGMAFTGVSDLEAGIQGLQVDRLVQWARVLGWTVHIDLAPDSEIPDPARRELRELARRASELLDDNEIRTVTMVLRMALASKPNVKLV
jgi:transcriptional regulator with XRE-family HTH domain